MSHLEKVVFALRTNEFSFPVNETSFSHVSLAGNEISLILSAEATMQDVQLFGKMSCLTWKAISEPNYVAQVDLKCTST